MPTANGQAATLSDEQLGKILEPGMPGNSSTFVFGKNADGSPRTWKLEPLEFAFERQFRKHVMPLLGESFKPFEVLIMQMGQKYYTDLTPSFVSSVFSQEVAMDDHVVAAFHAILFAQDQNVTAEWVEKSAKSRKQMMDIIYKEAELCKMMDDLGESLAGRLEKLAGMMGVKIDLVSLRQQLKRLSEVFSAKILNASTTVGNAIGPSLENSSDNMIPKYTPKTRSGIDASLDIEPTTVPESTLSGESRQAKES